MISGDGWVQCAAGHRHWGRFGAAGLLLHSTADGAPDVGEVILQHRAPWTHEGDRWGIPGGARHSDEDTVTAALREAAEEAGLRRADVRPVGVYVDDHGGWTYSTVVGRAVRRVEPVVADAESVTVRWQPVARVAELPLHSGFAAAWPALRTPPPSLCLRAGARVAGDPRLALLAQDGIAADRLPSGVVSGGLHRLYPHLTGAADDDPSGQHPTADCQLITVHTVAELVALAGPEFD